MRTLILSSALALALLGTGCQTTHSFATPDASWKSHVGQLKYSNRKRTLIGEVVVQRRGTKEFQLDFLKAGSFRLMSIREDAAAARTDGLLVRGAWQGSPAAAPKSLRPWLALREAFLQTKPAMPGGLSSWQGQSEYRGGELSSLFLAFPEDDQRFVFQFNR